MYACCGLIRSCIFTFTIIHHKCSIFLNSCSFHACHSLSNNSVHLLIVCKALACVYVYLRREACTNFTFLVAYGGVRLFLAVNSESSLENSALKHPKNMYC